MPESKGRKRDDYVPPPDKTDRKPVIQDLPAFRERMMFSYVTDLEDVVRRAADDETAAKAVDTSGPVRSGRGRHRPAAVSRPSR